MIKYVIYNPETRLFIKTGRFVGFTYSLKSAKTFVSAWAAERYLGGLFDKELYIIKEIAM